MQRFLVKRRGEHDFVVVHKSDVDNNGNLKKEAKPISQNHRNIKDAQQNQQRLEAKYGVSYATNSY